MATAASKSDIYTRVTEQIIAAIEAGTDTWRMPWHHDGSSVTRPTNVASGKAYRGSNILTLWASSQLQGFTSGLWASYRQWSALGAQVRKGETATTVVFWKSIDKADDQDADEQSRRRLFAKGYSVFNLQQVDGYAPDQLQGLSNEQRIEAADAFHTNLGIATVHGGNEAFYMPLADTIHMPVFAQFEDPHAYYGTLFHEALHATGAKHRCDRNLSGRFGSESYATEEICADLGAAMVMAQLGLAHSPRADHAAYIAHWLTILREDPRAIFTIASKSQTAVDWMLGQQPPG